MATWNRKRCEQNNERMVLQGNRKVIDSRSIGGLTYIFCPNSNHFFREATCSYPLKKMSAYVSALIADVTAAAGLPPIPYVAEYGPVVLLIVAVHLGFVLAAKLKGPIRLTPLSEEVTNPPLPQQQTTAGDGKQTPLPPA